MSVVGERAALLPFTHLAKGGHPTVTEGVCLLEAVAYVAGEAHSDHPECASPILGSFGRSLNDVLPDDKRQQLVHLIPAIVGTADDGHDQERGLMAADWIIRTYTPTWLRLAGMESHAVELETLPRRASWDDVEAAVPALRAAEEEAYRRRDAAWAAAGDAAGDAARAAAWGAARGAARDAAWAAAGGAAWGAAGGAAWAAAGGAAWAAARDAARDHLAPTVALLQDSAIDLYTRMVHMDGPS